FASPEKAAISRSMPYLAKMPSCAPTSSGVNVHAVPTDLPTRTLSAACAGRARVSALAMAANAIEAMRKVLMVAPGEIGGLASDRRSVSYRAARDRHRIA